jgi:hypothetical protein
MGTTLSGGQKQRILLARAFLADPSPDPVPKFKVTLQKADDKFEAKTEKGGVVWNITSPTGISGVQVALESGLVFPLLKGSDVAREAAIERAVVVPQRAVSEPAACRVRNRHSHRTHSRYRTLTAPDWYDPCVAGDDAPHSGHGNDA